jgi:hypothetical protein
MDQERHEFLAGCSAMLTKYDLNKTYHSQFLSKCATQIDSHASQFTLLEHKITNMNGLLNAPPHNVDLRQRTILLSNLSRAFRDSLGITGRQMQRYVDIFQAVEEKMYKYCAILASYKKNVDEYLHLHTCTCIPAPYLLLHTCTCTLTNTFEETVRNDIFGSMDAMTGTFISFLDDVDEMRGEIASVVARVKRAKSALPRIAEAA